MLPPPTQSCWTPPCSPGERQCPLLLPLPVGTFEEMKSRPPCRLGFLLSLLSPLKRLHIRVLCGLHPAFPLTSTCDVTATLAWPPKRADRDSTGTGSLLGAWPSAESSLAPALALVSLEWGKHRQAREPQPGQLPWQPAGRGGLEAHTISG